jgi:transporter family protein
MLIPAWLPPALFALLNFGLWGLFTKMAVLTIDPKSAMIYQTLGVMTIAFVMLMTLNFKPTFEAKGFGFSLLTGLTYGLGCLFYFIAASRGKIINVVTLTALYPIVTLILAYFILKETIQLKQALGICLALVAIVLMSN